MLYESAIPYDSLIWDAYPSNGEGDIRKINLISKWTERQQPSLLATRKLGYILNFTFILKEK